MAKGIPFRQVDDLRVLTPVYITPHIEVPGIGAASAYVAGDAFGVLFMIPVPIEGTISNAFFYDYDNEGKTKDLVLFIKDVVATADNSAYDVSDADLRHCVGVIRIDTFRAFTSNQLGEATPALAYVAPQGKLWCQIVTQGVDNIAATAIPTIRLVVV